MSNILYQKLDIIMYIKNMLIYDVMNESLFNSKSLDIMNFLCRPVISINKNNEKEEISKLNHNYNEIEFDKFYDGISELIQKQEKNQSEYNLILLSEKKLLELS
jgi:hypothetical protein